MPIVETTAHMISASDAFPRGAHIRSTGVDLFGVGDMPSTPQTGPTAFPQLSGVAVTVRARIPVEAAAEVHAAIHSILKRYVPQVGQGVSHA